MIDWIGDIVKKAWSGIKSRLSTFLNNRRSQVNLVTNITIAFSTATSAFNLVLQLTPIILSCLTVLAAIPLFKLILPQTLLSPVLLLPVTLAICIYAGYHKYCELVPAANWMLKF